MKDPNPNKNLICCIAFFDFMILFGMVISLKYNPQIGIELIIMVIIFVSITIIIILKSYHKTPQDINEEILKVIEEGETQKVEFKSSLRWDINKKQVNKDLERVVMKSISGFMNTEGGLLFIGVDDEGRILGLNKDYRTLGGKKSKDEFGLKLTTLLKEFIGPEFSMYWKPNFIVIEDKEICMVKVKKSDRPVFTKPKKGSDEEFFVRTGPQTIPLSKRETIEYVNDHFKS